MRHYFLNKWALVSGIFLLLVVCFVQETKAQDPIIKNAIENLTEQSDQEYDYSDLLDEFMNLMQNPININSEETEKLIPLFLLDELLYQNLRLYIKENGQIVSIQELILIEGFTPQTITSLEPFIVAEPLEKTSKLKPKNIAKYGKHEIFLRYQRTLQTADGYKDRTDSLWNAKPTSKYLGNADKYYLKYKFKYSDKLSAGLVAEKDAGEIFLENVNNPTLDSLIGDRIQKGFDFYTGNIYAQDLGFIEQAVVGDYHLLFGQGLNMWSALAFGKSGNAVSVKKYARGIKPNSSTDENKFLRGAAVKLGYKKLDITVFYSSKKQDASDYNIAEDQENYYLSSINGTGFHRTVNELLKKEMVKVSLYGSRVSFSAENFNIGITASQTKLDKDLLVQNNPYQYFNFKGKENAVIGGDYSLRLLMLNIFGEFSYNLEGGWAYIGGLDAPLSNRVALAFVYRNYQKDYVNLFGAAFGENSLNQNEQGFYTGISFQMSKKWKLNGYVDIFKFPWLKYRVDAPSFGSEYFAQLDYEYSRKIQMQFKARYKNKQLNYSDIYDLTTQLQDQEKYGLRYSISYRVHPNITLKNRVEYQIFETLAAGKQSGFLIFQDVAYKSTNKRLGLSGRFAIFDVEDYDARIYAYESDLLYVFSIPAYYNRGMRVYAVLNYEINKSMDFWFKIANTWYENVDEIGSGLDRIEGSNKTEVRFQLRIKI